jgi:hypothetical protein
MLRATFIKPTFLFVLFFAGFSAVAQNKTVNVSDFGLKPNMHTDGTPAITSALSRCKKVKAAKLIFPKGRYDFWPDRATEKYLFTSNNDEGLKRIAFLLTGLTNFEIDGQGSEFIFHGYISPFVLEKCQNIAFKNFSIDWDRTFDNEGKILSVYKDSIDVSFSKEYPYKIENNLLLFTGDNNTLYPYGSLLEFDPVRRETAYMAEDYYTGPNVPVKSIGEGKIRLYVPGIKGTPDNIMVFGAAQRFCSAIVLSDSKQIKLSDINIYHAGGMGVIAQRSRDITLKNINVTPRPNSPRMLSTTADATHFANCTGKIVFDHCLFENQEDDATNIHGVYVQITKVISPNTVEVKLKHEQQFGFDFLISNMSIEFATDSGMNTISNNTVLSATRINKEYTLLVCKNKLDKNIRVGDVIASTAGYPDVLIKNCTIQKNRARGILLGSRGKIVVEDNVFHTAGAAILFEGNARFWFEQAGVMDCIIRNNTFDNCNYGVWGNAVIQVGSGIEPAWRDKSRYNRNIVIENNVFKQFDPRILNIYSVDGLTFKDNTIVPSTSYKSAYPGANPFVVNNSAHIVIQ